MNKTIKKIMGREGSGRQKMKYILIILCLVLPLSGCATSYYGTAITRGGLNKIELGMTKEQVKKIMGSPYKREAYQGVEYWLYATEFDSYGFWYGTTSDRQLTPIAFIDGKVDGWGRNYYEDRKKKLEADITIKNR